MYERCIKIQVPDSSAFNGILLVGEAPGAEEEKTGIPFVGKAGQLLGVMLNAAGINRAQCAVTNVFHVRPTNNQIKEFFTVEKEGACFPDYPMGYAYLRTELAPEIKRLSTEIHNFGNHLKVIVALGGIALWALTGKTGITKQRGLLQTFSYGENSCLLVPTFHPSYLLHKNSPAEEQLVVQDFKLALSIIEDVK